MLLKTNSKKDILVHLGAILGVVLVLIFIFFYLYLPITTHHGESIQVPELKGKSLEEVEALLNKHHLRYQVNDSTYVMGTPPLSVISQHPASGSEVKENRILYITVTSKNPPMVPMPELKDKSPKTAEIELKSRDLILAEKKLVPSPFENLVLKQLVDGNEIPAGTLIPKGTKVTIEVGNGIEDSVSDPETDLIDTPE